MIVVGVVLIFEFDVVLGLHDASCYRKQFRVGWDNENVIARSKSLHSNDILCSSWDNPHLLVGWGNPHFSAGWRASLATRHAP